MHFMIEGTAGGQLSRATVHEEALKRMFTRLDTIPMPRFPFVLSIFYEIEKAFFSPEIPP